MNRMKRLLLLFLLLAGPAVVFSQVPETRIREAQAFYELFTKRDAAGCFAMFGEGVASKISIEQLEQLISAIEFQLGPVESTGAVRTEESERFHIVYIPCHFKNASLDMKVVFPAGEGKIAGFFLAPAEITTPYSLPPYTKGLKYREEETVVRTGSIVLPATLTFPPGEGPFALVVMVHGSGPNDRDETVGASKVFKDLAIGLASQGIASLRYEKRTRVYGTEMDPETITLMEETVLDALSAVDTFRLHPEIDPEMVYILGHSLGAMAAPRIAGLAVNRLAGIIMLAANANPLEDLILHQVEYIYSADSLSAWEEENLSMLRQMTEKVKSRSLSPATPSGELPLGIPAVYWLDLRRYDQVKTAARLKIPVLILQGGRDYQVPVSEYEIWKKKLGRKKNVGFRLFPELNHLFIPGEGPSLPSEYLQPGNVPLEVMETIANWMF